MKLRRRMKAETGSPTPERIAHAEGNWRIAGDARSGNMIYQMVSPLERLLAAKRITEIQHDALWRLWAHWADGQVNGCLRSPDLNRITAAGNGDPLAACWHRDRFDFLWNRLDVTERHIVSAVVLFEISVPEVARILGFASPYHGREAVLRLLRSAADRLARP